MSAFLNKFKGLLFFGTILGILIFFLLRIFIPQFIKYSSQKIGWVGQYTSDQLPENMSQAITFGLTRSNDRGELEPGIASQWETPDQGKTWIFHLDTNLKWQDGKEITSQDINYSFKDVEIERPDLKIIVFKLKDRFSPFPYIVSRPVFKRGLMGVGDWKVETINLYHNNIDSLMIRKGNKSLTYKFYPTEERAKLAFKLGEIRAIEEAYNFDPFDKWQTVSISGKTKYNQIIILFLNNKNSQLAEKSLRQALSYAIDKKKVKLERCLSPISPLSWAYNPQVKNYNFDPQKAKDGLKNYQGKLKLNFFTTPLLLSLADSIAADWKEYGVESNVQISSIIPAEFDAFLAIIDIPNDPDQYSLWHSTQSTSNISYYSNQRIDKLLEDGRAELDLEERKKIYLDFQRYLVEDSPVIFLYHPTVYTIERK